MTKDIVIMAKSIKHYPNYCIAGIDIKSGEWIRPVSDDDESECAVLEEDAIYEDGTEVKILDIVRIEFVNHSPNDAQYENYQYDCTKYWKKIGEISLQNVIDIYQLDNPKFIFGNDEKAVCDEELTGTSLLFLKIQNPTICVKTFERKKVSINFTYNNIEYRYIQIGDSELYKKYKTYPDGYYQIANEKIAVFSLTGKYIKDGKYYKMLAQLF